MFIEHMTADALAKNLRYFISQKDWNIQDLAEAAHVKASFIYDILNGKSTNPSAIKLDQLARAMHLSIDMLLHGQQQNTHHSGQFVQPETSDHITRHSPLQFNLEWLRQRTNCTLSNLSILKMDDDSMAPTISREDWVLCDHSHASVTTPGIYLLSDGTARRILRAESCLKHQRSFIRLLPDNPRYSRDEVPSEHLTIMGRVIWHSQWL